MELANFFSDAARRRPINPRPIDFTLTCREVVLPGGAPNPGGQMVATRATGAFIFQCGDAQEEGRAAARAHLTALCAKQDPPLVPLEMEIGIEYTYQMVYRVVFQWDPSARKAGKRLFQNVEEVRSLMVFSEADRVFAAYLDYVKEEHPAAIDAATFREAGPAGARVAGGATG